MATMKSGWFTIEQRVTCTTTGTFEDVEIDLGSYVDPGDNQALEIGSVDFIFGSVSGPGALNSWVGNAYTATGAVNAQLSATNQSGLVFPDDDDLIASGQILLNATAATMDSDGDMYPDQFGKEGSGYHVVTPSIFLGIQDNGTRNGANDPFVVVRIRCRVVKLNTKDWMAIALERNA